MSEIVERVARAICAARGDDPDERCEDWMKEFSGWSGHQESARAAIEAMREPTEAIKTAGMEAAPMFLRDDTDGRRVRSSPSTEDCAKIFKAMIDEALR